MAVINDVVLPKKLHMELFKLTEKENMIDAIKELISREINRKRNKYLLIVKIYEKKYNKKFAEFEKTYKDKKMNCEIEKDYFDWDMAVTVLEDTEEELKTIK